MPSRTVSFSRAYHHRQSGAGGDPEGAPRPFGLDPALDLLFMYATFSDSSDSNAV